MTWEMDLSDLGLVASVSTVDWWDATPLALGLSIPSHIYVNRSAFVSFPSQTTMSGCTLQLSRNSPLRTVLVDEATGQAKYKIDTPRKVARSVTWIRKFDPPSAQPPLHRGEDADPDPGDNITNKGKKRVKSKGEEDRKDARDKTDTELPETGDEIARIYWKWFSPHKIVFRGRIITRNQFAPKAGKMKV